MNKTIFLFAFAAICSTAKIYPQDQGMIPICCDDPITDRGECLKLLVPLQKTYNFQIEGAYLYWEALSDGFDYIYTFVVNGTALGNNFQSDATLEHAQFNWKSSPRISAAVAGEIWDSKASWTHYEASDSQYFVEETLQSGTVGAISKRLNLIWLDISASLAGGGAPRVYDNFTSATQASAKGEIKYDTIDWVAGASIAFNKYFLLRPFAGIRSAFIRQYLKMYSENHFPSDPLDFVQKSTDQVNSFRGAGIHFGAQGAFRASSWFSFYAEGAISVLAGSFKIQQNQRVVADLYPQFPMTSSTDMSRPALRPAILLGAGIDLNYKFYRDEFALTLSGGYEVNYWPYQNQWVRFFGFNQEFKHPGDLILHGAVVKGSLIF